MKIILKFSLTNSLITADYRPFIVSYFKHALSSHNKELYDKYYGEKYQQKDFCFSVRFNSPKFEGNKIIVDGKEFEITLSVMNAESAIDFYNAFVLEKNKSYAIPENNQMVLKRVSISNHTEIKSDTILIKMLSPILARKNIDGKNKYLLFSEEDFIPHLTEIIKNNICSVTGIQPEKIGIKIECVFPKKTVTDTFGTKVTANLGVYKIKSDPYILNIISKLGIGSRRSEGFGLFEIINQKG